MHPKAWLCVIWWHSSFQYFHFPSCVVTNMFLDLVFQTVESCDLKCLCSVTVNIHRNAALTWLTLDMHFCGVLYSIKWLCVSQWEVHFVDSIGLVVWLLQEEVGEPCCCRRIVQKQPVNDMLCPLSVLEGRLWWDGMILDNKHLAHAANLSGGPGFCGEIRLCLDGTRANIHWTSLWRTSQWSGIYPHSKAESKRADKS